MILRAVQGPGRRKTRTDQVLGSSLDLYTISAQRLHLPYMWNDKVGHAPYHVLRSSRSLAPADAASTKQVSTASKKQDLQPLTPLDTTEPCARPPYPAIPIPRKRCGQRRGSSATLPWAESRNTLETCRVSTPSVAEAT